jgi:hydroxyacylglutathione hydrolase
MTQEQLVQHQTQHADHLFVLDVRTPQEFAAGHVPGAVNVPHDELPSRLAEVPRDKDVVLYCRSGRRSALAADVLAANGYTRVSHLEGDMNAWVERGRPIEKP